MEQKHLYLNKKLSEIKIESPNKSISYILKKYYSSPIKPKYGFEYERELEKHKYEFNYDEKTKHLNYKTGEPVYKTISKNPSFKYQYNASEDEEEQTDIITDIFSEKEAEDMILELYFDKQKHENLVYENKYRELEIQKLKLRLECMEKLIEELVEEINKLSMKKHKRSNRK